MGEREINEFLTHIAANRNVAANTQNQALNAIVFFYKEVLKKKLGDFGDFQKAKTDKRLPVVFTKEETKKVIMQLDGTKRLMASLLYGSGGELLREKRIEKSD